MQVHVHIHQRKGHALAPPPPQGVLVHASASAFAPSFAFTPQMAMPVAAAPLQMPAPLASPLMTTMAVPVGMTSAPQNAALFAAAGQTPAASPLGLHCFSQADLQALQSRLNGGASSLNVQSAPTRQGGQAASTDLLRELLNALKNEPEQQKHDAAAVSGGASGTTASLSTADLDQLEDRYDRLDERIELLTQHAQQISQMTELLRTRVQENTNRIEALQSQVGGKE